MLFAIDQQQYLQGYLPVVFAVLFVTNLNTVGNGAPVLTGPGHHQQGERGEGRGAREEGHALDESGGAAPPAAAGLEDRDGRDRSAERRAGRTARHGSARSPAC